MEDMKIAIRQEYRSVHGISQQQYTGWGYLPHGIHKVSASDRHGIGIRKDAGWEQTASFPLPKKLHDLFTHMV